MPFRSKAQQRFLFARHPKIAREFAAKTKDFSKLPERVGGKRMAKKKKPKKRSGFVGHASTRGY